MDNEFVKKVMEETGLEIKENSQGRAMFHNGIPLVWSINQSDEYLKGFAMGFARCKAMGERRKM